MSNRTTLLFCAVLLVVTLATWTAVLTWTFEKPTPTVEVDLKPWLSGGDSPLHQPGLLSGGDNPMHQPGLRFCLTNDDCVTLVGGTMDDERSPTWWTLGTCNSAAQRCNNE